MKTLLSKNQLLIACVLMSLVFLFSCDKDSPLNPAGACFGGNWSLQYADELETWSNAAQAYADDPTPANCTNYKSAAKDYYDALNDVYDCVPTASRQEIDQAIKEAKAEIDAQDCNQQSKS